MPKPTRHQIDVLKDLAFDPAKSHLTVIASPPEAWTEWGRRGLLERIFTRTAEILIENGWVEEWTEAIVPPTFAGGASIAYYRISDAGREVAAIRAKEG